MEDKDRIKIILQMLAAEIRKQMPAIKDIHEDGDKSVQGKLEKDDIFYLLKACTRILDLEEFFGLTEAERIIKGSKRKPLSVAAKKSLGFEGCFE